VAVTVTSNECILRCVHVMCCQYWEWVEPVSLSLTSLDLDYATAALQLYTLNHPYWEIKPSNSK